MRFTNSIAIGVGAGRMEEAATFFVEHMGGVVGEKREEWIQVKAGPIDFYLVGDSHGTPTFDVLVEDIDDATNNLLSAGCSEIDLGLTSGERAVRTPFGQFVCISRQP